MEGSYIKQYKIKICFTTIKDLIILTKIVDPDEMSCCAAYRKKRIIRTE